MCLKSQLLPELRPIQGTVLPAGCLCTMAADQDLTCREEGSNGDREMAAAMWHAGLEPWDITMSDLLQGRASLDSFSGEV